MNKKEMVCYNTDASRLIGNAEKIVFPKNVQSVQKIIQTSTLDIVPRGAGSERVGGVIPNNSIVVDMSKMIQVSDFNPKNMSVKVEAGITIGELNERLNKVGFEFPIQTNNQGISTIGGMIAMNQLGNRSTKYGTMKDWIQEIDLVNGRGELMKIHKSDLGEVCGMEGITGIIVSAVLKIAPKIKRSASIFQSEELEEIFSIARRLKLEKEISSLNLFPPKVSKLSGLPEKYHLLIEFDSERGKIKGKDYEIMTNLIDKAYYVLASEGYYNSEDPRFFFDKLYDFICFLEENKIPYFGKVDSGVIYAFFKDDEKEKEKEIMSMITRMGGKPGEYGIGLSRKNLKDSFERKIIQRIKLRHDPFGKINKNKVIDMDFKTDSRPEPRKVRDFNVPHLKPIKKEEIEEIKPFLEEEIEEEVESIKSPEEKMEEFIEKVELIDKTVLVEKKEIQKPEIIEPKLDFGAENKLQDPEIKNKLQDYESTYKSELIEEKKEEVEEFVKNIPHDILHPKGHIQGINENQAVKIEEQIKKQEENNQENNLGNTSPKKRGKLSKEEEDKIKRIMFGG